LYSVGVFVLEFQKLSGCVWGGGDHDNAHHNDSILLRRAQFVGLAALENHSDMFDSGDD
jgi:hypothetical protein